MEVEAKLQRQLSDSTAATSALGPRVDSIERSTDAHRELLEKAQAALHAEFAEVSDAVIALQLCRAPLSVPLNTFVSTVQ